MSRRRCEAAAGDQREAGFTLFEVLIVMVMLVLAMTAVATMYRTPSSGTVLKTSVAAMASRLRDLRAAAIATASERVAAIDVDAHSVEFGDGRAPLQLDRSFLVSVTGADSERPTPRTAGIRFFPNGGSTGATIQVRSERQAYEVRVNWLTGRVSTSEIE